ncbi:hypothetical protein C8J57DRAFT_1731051 [Mycena rebaudengoi]|nr:hypothetical protein C8J57DRAFT_1731051 [Mycena rebaudengoi]
MPFTDVTCACPQTRPNHQRLLGRRLRPYLLRRRRLRVHHGERDFLEIVSSSYHPGLIPLTLVPSLPGCFDPAADFIIMSISLPTVSLTDTVRARATRDSWALTRKGQLARTGEKLHFQVGLCGRYKPVPVETVRVRTLIPKDAADEVRAAKEREIASWDADADNAERFEQFSSSETLLDVQLLKLVWIRRTFNVGPLCTRYCIVCYEKLTAEVEALKPYVSATPNYAHTSITPSIVARRSRCYEIIHNLQTVDLLVSLTISAACLFPSAWDRCPTLVASSPPPTTNYTKPMAATPAAPVLKKGLDGLVEFDELSVPLLCIRMADPITITTTIITLATFIKDLIDVGQNIRRSIEKVGENRRRIREVVDDILGTLVQLANFSRGREDSFQAQELLDAIGNLKADMLHVLAVAQKISTREPRSGFRGLQSQFKNWLEREDVEAQVKRLNKHVKKCYIQFTAFSAARIENTSVRVEQRLITNSVEHHAKLQRLEGMVTRVLVQTQFGLDVVNRTIEIIASDPDHESIESQFLSLQAVRLVDAFQKYTASTYFQSEEPHWDPVEEPLKISFGQPKSGLHILQKILTVMLQIEDHPTTLSTKDATEMLLELGGELSWSGLQSVATASSTLAVQVFRHLASGENFVGCLPRLAFALRGLSRRYQYQLQHESAVQASEQSVYWCHVASEGEPNVDNRALLLMSLNIHSTNLRATGQIDAAISAAHDALTLSRALLPETFQLASTEPNWALQCPEYEFQASECAQSFFRLGRALSDASRHREAFLASKEGFEVIARFSGAIAPPSGSDIDAFFNHMCKMAEAGDLPQDSLADVAILYGNLSRIYPLVSREAGFRNLHAQISPAN